MLNIQPKDKRLSKYTFIDLFAGIGGFHLALESFGATCVFASEWDKHAAKVYEANFGIKPTGDITLINEKDIPKHDILCAGFPCQAFSISGKQKGFEDSRGTLFYDIVRIVKHHKPSVLFLENVKNFERHDGGKTLKTVEFFLNKLGYDFFHQVLNASDYLLPQNRQRIYFVCFRKDMNISGFQFPKKIMKRISLNDVLEKKSTGKVIDRPDIKMYKPAGKAKTTFGEADFLNKPHQIGIVNKGGQGERIYHPMGHAITLSAYGGGVGAKTGLYYINNKVRKLSARECARVQGFPDTFIIDANDLQAYKQFGNAVPVNVLQEILKQIIIALND